jgi:sec-independent protein translocase protein TatA
MMESVIPLFPGLPGGPELLIVLFVLVLLFGANKIPKLARSTGQAMGEFQRGRNEIEEELEEMQNPDDESPEPGESTVDSDTTSVSSTDSDTTSVSSTDSDTTSVSSTDAETESESK